MLTYLLCLIIKSYVDSYVMHKKGKKVYTETKENVEKGGCIQRQKIITFLQIRNFWLFGWPNQKILLDLSGCLCDASVIFFATDHMCSPKETFTGK